MLLDYNSMTLDNIKIKKPYKISESKTFFDIKYNDDELFLQSPSGLMPYKPFIADDGYGYIDLIFSDSDLDFIKIINQVEESIVKRVNKSSMYKGYLENKHFHSCIMLNRMRFTHTDITNIPIFNPNKERYQADVRSLKKDDKHLCIFQIKALLVRASSYSIIISIAQIQVLNVHDTNISLYVEKYRKMLKLGVPLHVIRQGLLLEGFSKDECQKIVDELNIFEKAKDGAPPSIDLPTQTFIHENDCGEFAVYYKMLKLGIPLDAVKHKMIMDNISKEAISKFQETLKAKNASSPPPLPPPPPPPLSMMTPSLKTVKPSIDPSAFLADIKNGNFTLKRSTNIPNSHIKNRVLRLVDTRLGVPSLAEILNAKQKLKSTKDKHG